MVSFKIGKEKEKGVFRLVTIVGQRKKFPMRNRTSNLRIPRSDALPLSHIDSTFSEIHMTPVLHAAKINNVDSVIFVDRTCHNSLKLAKG